MNGAIQQALAELPPLIAAHLRLSGSAIAIGTAAGLPMAIWAARSRRAGGPLLAAAALVQTIPALALLALFYPLLLALARITTLPIPALGFLPALLALSLYALLPVMRNGVAAIRGIDPAVIEAADGIGMTGMQKLKLVELPLAAPVIIAGIRTASVWTIGAATLATTVGQPSLGDLIFSGLQTENWTRVLAGCFASALLALGADGLFALIEAGLARRSRPRIWTGSVLLAAAMAASVAPFATGHADAPPVTVGAKNFTEQYILASAIEQRLQAAGYRTRESGGLGSAVAYRALAAGDIDVYVDYGGTLWANILGRSDHPPSAHMLTALKQELMARDGVLLLGPLGFENAYAFAMPRGKAQALGVASLADLARAAPSLTLGSDLEFLSRPEWKSVQSAYGLRFAASTKYSPTFMYRAAADGSADVISAFSSDGRIAAQDMVTLSDPLHALPAYDAVLLISPRRARDQRFLAVLRPLIGAITIDRMRNANLMVDRDQDKRSPETAAKWLLDAR